MTAQHDPVAIMAERLGGWEALARRLYALHIDGSIDEAEPVGSHAPPAGNRRPGRPRKHELQFWWAAHEAIGRLVGSGKCHNQEVAAEEVINKVRHLADIKTAESQGANPSYTRRAEIERAGILDLLEKMLEQRPIGLRLDENGNAIWDCLEYVPSVSINTNARSFIKRMNEQIRLPDWLQDIAQ